FSHVRVHSGAESARLNDSLHAQAFTYGRDIWLGQGESSRNLSLMAHELTHVVQQSPATAIRPPPARQAVQRKTSTWFAPLADERGGAGNKSHDIAFEELSRDDKNKGLLFEVNIPGAKKGVVATRSLDEDAVVGRADFFKADTTIGVKFVGASQDPEYLASDR